MVEDHRKVFELTGLGSGGYTGLGPVDFVSCNNYGVPLRAVSNKIY